MVQARPDSDVDVLIGLDPAARFDLIDLVGVKNLLGDHLGREINVVKLTQTTDSRRYPDSSETVFE